jgi:ribosomal protein S18 acetylase RimI-like enzyme
VAASFLVRTARPAEYPAIGALSVAAYEADGQLAAGTGYEKVLADVADRAAHGQVLCAVDSDTGEVLGSVLFVLPGSRYAELSRPGEAEFRTLAVAPGAQRRGVGEALVRACQARALAAGCSAIVISVRDFSLPARRLYERLGFVRTPELDWTPLPGVELLGLRLDLAGPATA